MALNDQSKIGLGNRFKVKVTPGGWDLGSWAKVDGLDVTWEVPDYRMGDGWNARLLTAGATKYTAVSLTRAADSKDSKTVRDWLNKNAINHDVGAEVEIKLHDSFGAEVITWNLKNAVVKKWAITSFDAGQGSVAIERLEIDHEGFLDDEKKL